MKPVNIPEEVMGNMEEESEIYNKITEARESGLINKIIAVRHAESIANTLGIYQGQTYDTNLSDLGIKQAAALAARMRDFGVKKIISSPLKRTYQTALEISKVCGCEVEVNSLIVETNHGDWEGKSKEWIIKNHGKLYEMWFKKPGLVKFPNGEFFTETFKRVKEFIKNSELPDNTVVVTHDNIIRLLVTLANGFTIDDIWKEDVESAALNYFEINTVDGEKKLRLLKLNDNKHLFGIRADIDKHAL